MKYLPHFGAEFFSAAIDILRRFYPATTGLAGCLGLRAFAVAGVLASCLLGTAGAYAQTVTVDGTAIHQTIQGFGAYNAWSPNGSYNDLFFSTLGYSLLRVSLPIDDSCTSIGSSCANGVSSVVDMQACVANGCRVWATVSSPPGEMKTNGSPECTVLGASLLPGAYSAFATYMSNYISSLKTYYSIPLYAISAQNEPDTCAMETGSEAFSVMTGATLDTFIKNNLGPTLAAKGQSSTLIMMPESAHYDSYTGLAGPCMSDSSCASYIGINAFHDYDNASSVSNPYPGQFWETETSAGSGFGPSSCGGCWDPSISDAIVWSKMVHTNLVGGVNAFHYFWYVDPTGGNTNAGLINPAQSTPIAMRTYAIAQWAKFVRPGWVRIDATQNPSGGVDVTAFKNPATGDFALVAVNENGSSSALNVSLRGLAPTSVTPYVTATDSKMSQQAGLAVSGGTFAYTLAGQSVTTFVGKASGPPAPSNLTGTVVGQ